MAQSRNFSCSRQAASKAIKPAQAINYALTDRFTTPASSLGNALMGTVFNTFSGIRMLTLICISLVSSFRPKMLKFLCVPAYQRSSQKPRRSGDITLWKGVSVSLTWDMSAMWEISRKEGWVEFVLFELGFVGLPESAFADRINFAYHYIDNKPGWTSNKTFSNIKLKT